MELTMTADFIWQLGALVVLFIGVPYLVGQFIGVMDPDSEGE
jgi:hypothetical protein